MWRNEKCIRDMNLYPTFIMSPGHNSIYSSEILFSIFNSSSSSVRLLVTQKQLLKSIFSSARHEICLSCQHRYSEIFSLTTKRLQTGMTTAATTESSQDIFRIKRFNMNQMFKEVIKQEIWRLCLIILHFALASKDHCIPIVKSQGTMPSNQLLWVSVTF